jgi:hypothetical protein
MTVHLKNPSQIFTHAVTPHLPIPPLELSSGELGRDIGPRFLLGHGARNFYTWGMGKGRRIFFAGSWHLLQALELTGVLFSAFSAFSSFVLVCE